MGKLIGKNADKQMVRQPIVAGNWKMHGSSAENQQLLSEITIGLNSETNTRIIVFPPYVYLMQVAKQITDNESLLSFGAQNLSEQQAGAWTGEISASMLADTGCEYVLVGHSERRSFYHESDRLVAKKFAVALQAGLTPILCIGESLAEREAGETMDIVCSQLDAVLDRVGNIGLAKGIVAYEPVWAIGTGKTANPQQAQDVHSGIRCYLQKRDEQLASKIQILYGGSVNATNATELFAMDDIDGGLIGGASLSANDFIKICVAAG